MILPHNDFSAFIEALNKGQVEETPELQDEAPLSFEETRAFIAGIHAATALILTTLDGE